VLIAGTVALLILKEPDLGTSLLLIPVLLVMFATAGATRRGLASLVISGVVLIPVLWTGMSGEQKSRITAMFSQPGPDGVVTAETYQLHQAKQVLALGGFWGSYWSGQPPEEPAAYHLPEARGDFVFCVLGERFGVAGLGLVLGCYGLLVWRGFAVAAASCEPFGRLAAAGLTTLLATQVLVNTGMTVGLLPVTGVPLPLVSYGGSGLVAYGAVLGLLINIGQRPGYELSRQSFGHVNSIGKTA
jgi:rod shape determining protein RodA